MYLTAKRLSKPVGQSGGNWTASTLIIMWPFGTSGQKVTCRCSHIDIPEMPSQNTLLIFPHRYGKSEPKRDTEMYVNMCVCVHVYNVSIYFLVGMYTWVHTMQVQVCLCMCVHMCGGQRSMSSISLTHWPPIVSLSFKISVSLLSYSVSLPPWPYHSLMFLSLIPSHSPPPSPLFAQEISPNSHSLDNPCVFFKVFLVT